MDIIEIHDSHDLLELEIVSRANNIAIEHYGDGLFHIELMSKARHESKNLMVYKFMVAEI